MKIKSMLVSMLAVAALASCTKEKGEATTSPELSDLDVAYMSISVTTPTVTGTRGSLEDPGLTQEGAITNLYAIVFDKDKNVIHHSKENPVLTLTALNSDIAEPSAVRVTSGAKYLLVIANPGAEMMTMLNGIAKGTSYTSINQALSIAINKDQKRDILVDELRAHAFADDKNTNNDKVSKFAMINSGGIGLDGLEEILPKSLFYVGESPLYQSEKDAETAANAATDKQKIKIERLTAKLKVTGSGTVTKPENSIFTFGQWTLDVLNSTYFPYATKQEIKAGHTGTFYANNFYTIDPNYENASESDPTGTYKGLMYNKLSVADKYAPYVNWLNSGLVDYCIENTVAATEQKYQNLTRVIIEAVYYPGDIATATGFTLGDDWFRFAGKNYRTIEDLIAHYEEVLAIDADKRTAYQTALLLACDEFYTRTAALNAGINAVADFTKLTTPLLKGAYNDIPHGAEILKDDGCLRWYQKGRNYYYYEIRHDNTTDIAMDFGKYGVVRNNSYALNLTKVGGHGTPWYPAVKPDPDPKDPTFPDPKPEPEEPGPDKEPDPEDPVDEEAGYLTFEIEVAPWVSWATDFEI